MLRDKALIPLPHQHQHCLALCVRLDRAIQAGDVDLEAWQAEIQQMFEQEITFHFAAEEKELFPVAARFSELQPLVQELSPATPCCDFLFSGRRPFSAHCRFAGAGGKAGIPHPQRRARAV